MIKLILNIQINYFQVVQIHIDVQDQVNQVKYLPKKILFIEIEIKFYFFFD
jgi:hypothetical protein